MKQNISDEITRDTRIRPSSSLKIFVTLHFQRHRKCFSCMLLALLLINADISDEALPPPSEEGLELPIVMITVIAAVVVVVFAIGVIAAVVYWRHRHRTQGENPNSEIILKPSNIINPPCS